MNNPRYPQVYIGCDITTSQGNAFVLINSVITGLKSVHASKREIEQFKKEATSGDYSNLLEACSRWVDFEYWGTDE